MAIITYSTYIPDVVVYATGCPGPTIVDALRKTAIDFFHESSAYRVWVPAFDLTINTTTYTVTGAPTETEVCQIMALFCSGMPVQELTHEQFLARDPEWPSLTGTQAQYYTALDSIDTFNIIPEPTATVAGAFTMQIAVHPTLTSTGVEANWFTPWRDEIVDGALSRLLRIKDRAWTDMKEADKREASYLAGRTKARIQANKGNIRRDVTVQMRRWV